MKSPTSTKPTSEGAMPERDAKTGRFEKTPGKPAKPAAPKATKPATKKKA